MQLIERSKIEGLKEKYSDFQKQADAWEEEIRTAEWKTPHELKQRYPKASIIGDKNIVFNICGDKYRIWVKIDYQRQIIKIKQAGTHTEYNNWNIK